MSEPAHVADAPGDALDRLRAAAAAAPGEAAVRARLSQALLREGVAAAKTGARPRARELFEELSELAPDDERAWLWRASVAATVGEATTFLTRVLAIVPEHPQARAALERLRARTNGTASAPPSAAPGRDDTPASPPPGGHVAPARATPAASEPSPAAECLDTGTTHTAHGVTASEGAAAVPVAPEPEVESDWTGDSDPTLAVRETPAPFVAPQTLRGLPDLARPAAPAALSPSAPLPAPAPAWPPTPSPVPVAATSTAPRLVVVEGASSEPSSASAAPERPAFAAPGNILNLSRATVAPRREPAPARPGAPPVSHPASRANAAAAVPAADPPRGLVLVVDDSPTVTKVLDHELRKHRLEVVAAANGPDALKFLTSQLPDLVLLDINMPGMDGYQVCRAIRADERTRRIPVVMLSGKDGFFDKVRGRMAGAADYITKPFEPPRLVSMIAKYFPVRL